MAKAPKSVSIRSYHVGFGDCFLLSFDYGAGKEKHILVDYGSTGLPDGTPKTRMKDVANDIKGRSAGKLTAVVATHRHKDHISGFETKKNGSGTGEVIRALEPEIVIQPWTEQPDLKTDAEGPKLVGGGKQIAALSLMQAIAGFSLAEVRRSRFLAKEVRGQLSFLGDDNLANLSAVKNLMTMAPNKYVFAGEKSGLERLLPGVKVDVLGPPTVKQSAAVKKQRAKDPNEFWQFQRSAMALAAPTDGGGTASGPLFPHHVRSSGPGFPAEARWLIYHARSIRGDQLLRIVRMLDDAMNNTSVILLFRIGTKTLLFPGDAQIENWQYALSKKQYTDLLADVDFYKVGHHGSLNATPKSLWALFSHRSKKPKARNRLTSVVSTMQGKHGAVESSTEVPRRTLVSALDTETDFFTTEALTGPEFFHDTTITFQTS